jgi:flagellar biosynthesis GTPase FlhF
VDRTLRLMLRAFNGECDAMTAKVRFNNVVATEERIRKSFAAINEAGAPTYCSIATAYLELKLTELRITHELAEKVQEEKEEQRRIREQMREEEQARREIEKMQRDAEAEERRREQALAKARAEFEAASEAKRAAMEQKVADLEAALAEAHARTERAISQAQLTKRGHVYVISNPGSFGEDVFKVGMTRRLEPMERIRELGDASVPFGFDVHAVIYSEDAPGLEAALHRALTDRRVNLVNERKEFFRASLDHLEVLVREHAVGEVTFERIALAEEYRKTMALIEERARATDDVPTRGPETMAASERERFEVLRRQLLGG